MAYCDYLLDQQGNPTGHFWATFLVKYDIKSNRKLPKATSGFHQYRQNDLRSIWLVNVLWFMGDITGVNFSISGQHMRNPGKGRVGPPGPPGKQGPVGPKGSKGEKGKWQGSKISGKNENCVTPTLNVVEKANEARFVISVFIFQQLEVSWQ